MQSLLYAAMTRWIGSTSLHYGHWYFLVSDSIDTADIISSAPALDKSTKGGSSEISVGELT